MKKKYVFMGLCLLLGIIILVWSQISISLEHASYKVVAPHGSIEIRDYSPKIVAEVTVSGNRKTAIEKGFRLLADYIFGQNVSSKKIPMTAPVTQKESASETWIVRFMMPSSETLETLPKPNNPDVTLKKLPPQRFAVIRFSGTPGEEKLTQEYEKLTLFMAQQGLTSTDSPIYAFFNPPWTLPFFRRNEIMMEIKK